MLLTKTFMNRILSELSDFSVRIEQVEERLQSDRRAVPVLKDMVKDLRKDNQKMLDRIMSRDFEQLKVYTAHESEGDGKKPEFKLDEAFAGEVVDLTQMETRYNETQSK